MGVLQDVHSFFCAKQQQKRGNHTFIHGSREREVEREIEKVIVRRLIVLEGMLA